MMNPSTDKPAGRYSLGRRAIRHGFTLIEAALVTAIVSFGVIAMLELLASGTVANTDGAELTTATNLAKNIREMSLGLAFADPTTPTNWGLESGEALATFDDLDDLDGQTFSPPIDARRQAITRMVGWQQSVLVESVDTGLLTSPVPSGTTPAARVTVTVSRHGRPITSLSWVTVDASNN